MLLDVLSGLYRINNLSIILESNISAFSEAPCELLFLLNGLTIS